MAGVRVTYPLLDTVGVVERLRKALRSLEGRLPVSRMILFGSYAQGRYTAGSDIDVIVVYTGSEKTDAYKAVVDEVRLPTLEARVYTEEQFNSQIMSSPGFAKVLAEEGILITGDGD